jgi:hypothetical protein
MLVVSLLCHSEAAEASLIFSSGYLCEKIRTHGQRVPTRPCPKCGKDSPEHRYRFEHFRMIGSGQPRQVLKIVNWCGHAQDFVAWPEADGYWRLVSVLGDGT